MSRGRVFGPSGMARRRDMPLVLPGSPLSPIPHGTPGTGVKRVVVPTEVVGKVIGKGGLTISGLQARSGAYIKVTPDSETKPGARERVLYISGEPSAIALAHNLLNDIVNEGLERSERGNGVSERYPSNSVTAVMQVRDDKVGCIIGKGGATIREIEQRSGARIVVSKEVDTSREDRLREVTITGPRHFVSHARALISERAEGGDGELGGLESSMAALAVARGGIYAAPFPGVMGGPLGMPGPVGMPGPLGMPGSVGMPGPIRMAGPVGMAGSVGMGNSTYDAGGVDIRGRWFELQQMQMQQAAAATYQMQQAAASVTSTGFAPSYGYGVPWRGGADWEEENEDEEY